MGRSRREKRELPYNYYNCPLPTNIINMPEHPEEAPVMQRLYNNIWLLTILALVFFTLSYLVWGLLDVFSVPLG